jgi:predicted nucleotidyltransferase component of viral defense system
MITDAEIEQKATELDISPQNVERDYVHGWLLREIFTHQRLSNLLVLKGGNGIRKGYLRDTRYSKDLDFSCETALDENQLHADLTEVLEAAQAGSGVQFAIARGTSELRLLEQAALTQGTDIAGLASRLCYNNS